MKIICPDCGAECEITDNCFEMCENQSEFVKYGIAYCANCNEDVMFDVHIPVKVCDIYTKVRKI